MENWLSLKPINITYQIIFLRTYGQSSIINNVKRVIEWVSVSSRRWSERLPYMWKTSSSDLFYQNDGYVRQWPVDTSSCERDPYFGELIEWYYFQEKNPTGHKSLWKEVTEPTTMTSFRVVVALKRSFFAKYIPFRNVVKLLVALKLNPLSIFFLVSSLCRWANASILFEFWYWPLRVSHLCQSIFA